MTLDQFLPLMLIELPGCPEPLIRQALLRAADEFCRRTHAWSELQEPIRLEPGVRDYELDVPSGATVSAVLSVHAGSTQLRPVNTTELQRLMPDWHTAQASSPAYYNLVPERGVLSIFPTPSEHALGSIVVRAAYTPTLSATTLPDFLGQRYMDAITGGAKAILMAILNKPWSNPQLVPLHRGQLDNAMAEAAAEELHGRTVGSVSLRPRRFGVWG